MTEHRIGTQEEWQAERDELQAEEKELTHRGDELARGLGESGPDAGRDDARCEVTDAQIQCPSRLGSPLTAGQRTKGPQMTDAVSLVEDALTVMVAGRCSVEGDVVLAMRVEDMFGGS
jgi:hypothetical protein